MNYNKKTIMDVDVAGKKILLRCDFNVPQDKRPTPSPATSASWPAFPPSGICWSVGRR